MNKNVFKIVMPMLMALSLAGVGFSSYVFSGETGKTLQADLKVADTEEATHEAYVFSFNSIIMDNFKVSAHGFEQADGTYGIKSQAIICNAKMNIYQAALAFGSLDGSHTSFIIDVTLIELANIQNSGDLSCTGSININNTGVANCIAKQEGDDPLLVRFNASNLAFNANNADDANNIVSFSVLLYVTYTGTFSTFYNSYSPLVTNKKGFKIGLGAEAIA